MAAAVAALLCAFAAQAAFAQTPVPQQGSSTRPLEAQEATSGPRPIFAFHSGFWLNLHHFLYEQARLAEKVQTSQGGGAAKSAPTDANARGDAPAAWQSAVDYYRKNMAHRDLLFDQGMVLIGNRLPSWNVPIFGPHDEFLHLGPADEFDCGARRRRADLSFEVVERTRPRESRLD